MEKITNMKVVPCESSKWIKVQTLHYEQNGMQKTWDFMKVHDAVLVLIFNTDSKSFILVRQFRPAVYIAKYQSMYPGATEFDTTKLPTSEGFTYELCAGIMDKIDLTEAETAREEILEECGYDVAVENLHRISSYRGGVSTSAPLLTLFYTEVTDNMKVNEGGGLGDEGEYIVTHTLPLSEAKQFVYDGNYTKPAAFMFAFMWFFDTQKKYLDNETVTVQ